MKIIYPIKALLWLNLTTEHETYESYREISGFSWYYR